MLSPKYQRYADRLESLIEEGHSVVRLETSEGQWGSYIGGEDKVTLQSWLTRVRSILGTAFGETSLHYRQFEENLPQGGVSYVRYSSEVYKIVGVLQGALDDLKAGFLIGHEFMIAGEVFDSVLEQARHLLDAGYKDPAAVLARVVLEDALRRIARAEGIDDTLKPSVINDQLKAAQRYPQPQWRLIQAWLDVGNAAAHGQFGDYDAARVKETIGGIEQFLANELRI